MANTLYNNFKKLAFSGQNAMNMLTGDVKLMLVGTSYTFSQSHTVTGDIGASNEITSAGYKKGGESLQNKTLSIDAIENELVFDANDLTFTGLTATFAYGLLYISGNTPSKSHLIAQVDVGTQTLTASDFVFMWNTEGVINLM